MSPIQVMNVRRKEVKLRNWIQEVHRRGVLGKDKSDASSLKSVLLEALGSGGAPMLIYDTKSSSSILNGTAMAILKRRLHGFKSNDSVDVVKGNCVILLCLGATHLYNCFRSSFVKKHSKPLSSDAFSGFGRHNARENNDEVRHATEQLHTQNIQQFGNDLADSKIFFANASDLIKIMQEKYGINCRYIADVRRYIWNKNQKKDTDITQILFTECVFRTLKVMLRNELRSSNPQNASSVAATFLNNVFISKMDKKEEDDALSILLRSESGHHNTFWYVFTLSTHP
jgi:hypothetical protein